MKDNGFGASGCLVGFVSEKGFWATGFRTISFSVSDPLAIVLLLAELSARLSLVIEVADFGADGTRDSMSRRGLGTSCFALEESLDSDLISGVEARVWDALA